MRKQFQCSSCQHYQYCTEPCAAMRQLIWSKGTPLEKERPDREHGKIWDVTTPHRREMNFSTTEHENEDGETTDITDNISYQQVKERLNEIFSESAKHVNTQIFIDRFFLGLTTREVMEKHGYSQKFVTDHYAAAKKRVNNIIEALDEADHRTKRFNIAKAQVDRCYKLSNRQKCFLLYQCFALTQAEIADIVGIKEGTVTDHIYQARKQVKNGKFCLEFE